MKRMSWMLGAVVLGAFALTGCSSSEGSGEKTGSSSERLTVQGSVSNRLGTDNARAVAISADGKKVWTYLDKHGDFTLKLPVGKSYRVLIANQIPGGGQKVVGKLSLKNGATKTEWIGAKSGGKVDLGKLMKLDEETGATAPKCFCDEDEKGGREKVPSKDDGGWDEDEKEADSDWGKDPGGYGDKDDSDDGEWGGGGWDDEGDWGDEKDEQSDHDDDNGCFGDDEDDFGKGKGDLGDDDDFEKGDDLDDEEVCDVCTDGKVVDLEPSKKDAGDWGDVDAKENSKPESKVCPKKADVEAKKSTTEKAPTAEDKGEEIQSKKAVGDKCSIKNECGESVCIASKCVAK